MTDVIEDMLAEFQEIKEIKSISRAGISTVAIELLDAIDETDPIWTEMRDDLAALRANLPAGALEPEFVEFELAAYTWLVGLTWELDGPPERGISVASPRTWRMSCARSPEPTTWWSAELRRRRS